MENKYNLDKFITNLHKKVDNVGDKENLSREMECNSRKALTLLMRGFDFNDETMELFSDEVISEIDSILDEIISGGGHYITDDMSKVATVKESFLKHKTKLVPNTVLLF